MRSLSVWTLLGALALVGCRGRTSEKPPIQVLRNMFTQPRYMPQARSLWFDDGRTMRTPPEGTVAREMAIDPTQAEGRTPDGSGYVDQAPGAVVRQMGGLKQMVERGEDRFGIYCVPCHDGLGGGKGIVTQTAANPAFQPPSFHTSKLRSMPDGQLFATITYGVNNMPAYGPQIPVNDRWAIVSYVRALQLSMASNDAE